MEQFLTSAGGLGVIEFSEMPFYPQRIYWLFDTPAGVERGWHAHKKLEQFLVCASGKLQLEVDNGEESKIYDLDSMTPGVHIGRGAWRILRNMDSETVVLVLASLPYDPEDYIFDYREFLTWVSNR
jgi:dTDP-4-dehydrorhamnose 3,5-epimerase-like enzyme